MSKSYSVTTAGVNPAADRAHRERMYYIAMSLRVVCVGSLFWARGWWVLVAAAGAAFLPWFAVMVGNAVAHGGEERLDEPEPLQLESAGPAEAEPVEPTVIVVDVEPERRSQARDPASPEGSSDGHDGDRA